MYSSNTKLTSTIREFQVLWLWVPTRCLLTNGAAATPGPVCPVNAEAGDWFQQQAHDGHAEAELNLVCGLVTGVVQSKLHRVCQNGQRHPKQELGREEATRWSRATGKTAKKVAWK